MARYTGPALFIDPKLPRLAMTETVALPIVFRARYAIPKVGTVELEIESTGRTGDVRSRIKEVRIIEPAEGAGITGLDLKGVPLLELQQKAVENMGWLGGGDGTGARSVSLTATTRRRVDRHRLQEVADAYRESGIEGIETTQFVGSRQARRLKKRATEQGFIEEGE